MSAAPPGKSNRTSTTGSTPGVALKSIPMSDPVVHLDASNLGTLYQDRAGTTRVTAAGQSVGQWTEQVSGGEVLGYTSFFPVYQVVNEIPGIRFDGTKSMRDENNTFRASLPSGNGDRTIFFVVSEIGNTSLTNWQYTYSWGADTDNNLWGATQVTNNTEFWATVAFANDVITTFASQTNDLKVFRQTYTPNTVDYQRNDSGLQTSAYNSINTSVAHSSLVLGSLAWYAGSPLATSPAELGIFTLHELLIYDYKPSESVVNAMQRYLYRKWFAQTRA